MSKKEIDEIISLTEWLSDPIRWMVPSALMVAGPLMLINALMGRQGHNWFAYAMSLLGTIIFFMVLKQRKIKKKRLEELKGG